MSSKAILKKIGDCIVNFDVERIRRLTREAIEAGIPPLTVIHDGMSKGMDVVGKKFEDREYFLAELVMAGETMKTAMEVVEPYLRAAQVKARGVVVIGTVKGDLHDIGKNVVISLLKANGFETHDLDVDVPAESFVEKVRETKADIVAMSALLTTTRGYMKTVVDELRKAGLRDDVKIIVGGAAVTKDFASEIGVDAWAANAVSGVQTCIEWVEAKEA